MTGSGFDLGLEDPLRAGVFFVTADDLDTLEVAARDADLRPCRIDLAGCRDKRTLLLRVAVALDFPPGSGRNWDALADSLRDLQWLPARGHALLFDQASDLHGANEGDFDTLLSILDEACSYWATHDAPFWAFLALREEDFEALEQQAPEAS
ncbi:barnase inhibitor [Pseudoxanthomonas kalamensis DSM 18571]|uniref:barstar family protein n=1 Tax=Pseudoxanthomonas kalamensis TaxID=289483 RepID=UPI001391E1A1|nr:barstar family protein [Pseudoxanthomonas kalamensis]KAF1710505.1 barnase inhibitor [Pseudoxanthomonas kalamensis DSM 18571]